MAAKIVVAGGTGTLGGRIVNALLQKGAEVHAVVRPGTDKAKIARLEQAGVTVVPVALTDVAGLTQASQGAAIVVSVVSGLHEVIVEAQTNLVKAAIAAGVPRFIPSDYSADFARLAPGLNRNLNLRQEFHDYLDKAPIRATSILNGGFADMLVRQMTPLFDLKASKVSYFGDADQLLDFTTMDNVADYTANAALDGSAPEVLRIAGATFSPRQLAETAGEITGSQFELVRAGSLDDLQAFIQRERAADPDRDKNVFPLWQSLQYMHNMFSGVAKLKTLDNNRYSGVKWTTLPDLIASAKNN